METELVVIGGGPGGYSAAFRAAELGVETTIVDDRDSLGGAWLHDGCILSKDLLLLADTVRAAEHASAYGVAFGAPRIDLEQLRAGLRRELDEAAAALRATCDRLGITRVRGRARFDDSRQISIANSTTVPRIRFKRALIATGARPIVPDNIPLDDPRVMVPAAALRLEVLPETILVIGGSTMALELASIHAALGCRVTIVDSRDRLITAADDDLIAVLDAHLKTILSEVSLQTTVENMAATDDGITVDLARHGEDTPRRATFDRVLIAAGRVPNCDGLCLEKTKVQLDSDGRIEVDSQLRTQDPRIHAIGDVLGPPMLALKAAHQGRAVAEVVAGWGTEFDARVVPMVLFTDPQIAWCGLTEKQAGKRGETVATTKTCWSALGRTSRFQRTEGFTKIVHDPDTHLVLGVGIVGAGAAELIAEAALAIEMGAVLTDLAATIHPHPTHSECISQAARQAEDEADGSSRKSASTPPSSRDSLE